MLPGGHTIKYQYDGLLRPEKIEARDNANHPIHLLDYQYDTVNNITQKKYYRGIVDLNHDYATVDYDYSLLDRLTEVDYSDNVNEDGDYPQADERFSYDSVGNRTTDAKTGTNNWSYNQNNELQNFDDTSFKYNLNGQMTEKTVAGVKTQYSYNLDGRLKEIRDNANQVIAQYEYDPFGRRTKKYLPQANETVYFHYSQEGLIAEYNETEQLIQSYGYKPDSLFTTNPIFTFRPDFPHAKGYAYFINDHLGTPQKLITNTGRKVWETRENSFGKTIITNDEFRNPLRFGGQYFDVENNLNYNWFRFYDPQLGRYTTSDPIGIGGGISLYGYSYLNPLRYFDHLGLKPVCRYLGMEYARRYTDIRKKTDYKGKYETRTVLPGMTANDCIGLDPLNPPTTRGSIINGAFPRTFPCGISLTEVMILIEFYETITYKVDVIKVNHVSRCVDDCTGEVTFERIPGKDKEINYKEISSKKWRNEYIIKANDQGYYNLQ
jgi:RHS repeat-associated protein